jgi:hypothetical protein
LVALGLVVVEVMVMRGSAKMKKRSLQTAFMAPDKLAFFARRLHPLPESNRNRQNVLRAA